MRIYTTTNQKTIKRWCEQLIKDNLYWYVDGNFGEGWQVAQWYQNQNRPTSFCNIYAMSYIKGVGWSMIYKYVGKITLGTFILSNYRRRGLGSQLAVRVIKKYNKADFKYGNNILGGSSHFYPVVHELSRKGYSGLTLTYSQHQNREYNF